MRRASAVAAVALLALAAPPLASAAELRASVGPGFSISLRDAAGNPVTHLAPGEYRITVTDLSADHNFHLVGPGVDLRTDVETTGTVVWTVVLTDGVYDFACDPHDATLSGSFTVGTATPPPANPTPPATPAATRRLVATVGPGATITLRTAAGARVRSLPAGTYTIVVRDRSRAHNFHLVGRGVNRKTGVGATGTFTWRVTLRAGTYRYACDPHARAMRGSFGVR